MIILRHPDHRDSPILFPGKIRGLKIRPTFGNALRHHCLLSGHGPDATSFIQDSSVPFLNAWNCPFSNDEILSGCEDIVSLGTDQFTAWVKMDPHEVLVHHMVDVQKATTDFLEASERRPATSSQTPCQLFLLDHLCRRGSASTTGTLGRRGREDSFEKQIAGRLHVITLQEASEYVDHDILTGRFHVTHDPGCAILFNKDTFYPNIDVKSIYLHDTRRDLPDQLMEGEQGWVMQGVLSRASFQCCLYISATSTPRRKASPRSSFSLFVPS